MSRSPSAIASTAFAVSASRSMKASSLPSERAAFTSFAFAARIAFSRSTSASAASSSARFLAPALAFARSRDAARARSPISSIWAFSSALALRSLGMSLGGREDGFTREPEGELDDAIPGIAGLDALDHAVDVVRSQELAVEGGVVVPARGLLQCGHALGRDEAARPLVGGDRHHEAQLLGERPQQQRQR